jgi:uncharacterized protein
MSAGRALARRALLAAVPALLLLLPAAAARVRADADSTQVAIPAPQGFVNDVAGVLDELTKAKLEGFLDQLMRKTGVQFAVLTVRSTAPLDPGDYKVRVFESWKIGKQGKDDGLLLLVALDQRAVRFETGYGLEGTLPDGWQSRMVRAEMVPLLRQGDYGGAITRGVLASAGRIAAEKGVTLEWDGRELRYAGGRGGAMPGWVLALVIFLVVMSVMGGLGRRGPRPRGGGWMGPMWGGFGGGLGGWGGRGGFGGGGFGGGSFGGFGGGASGGGGGGGNW